MLFRKPVSNNGLEKMKRLQYYKSLLKKLHAEITLANAISLSRIPLVLLSFYFFKNNPLLLSVSLAIVYLFDLVDGYISRKYGLGNSPRGADIDIFSDHCVELIIVFTFAYKMGFIPKPIPWILAVRDLITDFLRFYNLTIYDHARKETHPHKAFGTFDKAGRCIYSLVKIIEAVVVPLIPSTGLWLSIAHVLVSLYRGWPILTSNTSQQIYRQIYENFTKRRVYKQDK